MRYCPDYVSQSFSKSNKGPLINYIRVLREGGLEKSLHTLTLGGRGAKPILT